MRSPHAAFLAALLLAAPAAARARAWQGVNPGATTETEVVSRFGQPSTQGKSGGRSALVYKAEQAIPGTRQAQFFLGEGGVVAEVVVFPAAQLDKEAVEGTYGKPSQKAFTEDFKPVWVYKAAGVTVFFGQDGYVEALSFKAGEAGGARHPASARDAMVSPRDATASKEAAPPKPPAP